MPTPFFQRLQLEPIHVAFEDIVPAASTAARVRQRAVYKDLIHQWPHFLTAAVRDRVESRLRPYRQPAWEGHLDTEACRDLLDAFLAFKADFRRDMDAFEAYAMINCCAALLAQMLFVDNCLKEGLGGVSHPDNQDTVTRLMRHIQDTYQAHQVPVEASAGALLRHLFSGPDAVRHDLCGRRGDRLARPCHGTGASDAQLRLLHLLPRTVQQ